MKELKPSRIETFKTTEEFTPSPQRVDKEFEKIEKEDFTANEQKEKGSFLKTAFWLSLVTMLTIGSIYDIFSFFLNMTKEAPILGTIYIFSFFVFLATIIYILFTQYKGYATLKKLETLQETAKRLQENPTEEVFEFAKNIIRNYKNHKDESIKESALKIERELEEKVFLKEEVMDVLEEKLFSKIDKKAYEIISKYSTQTALSTAISPVALIDMLLILSRSWAMITSIAELYGYKPNFTAKAILLKRVSFNLIFASVTDLASDYLSNIVGTSVLSKLSYHSAQGLANGILTARVGVSAIYACRILYLKKRINYVKYIAKRLLETLLGKGQAV